MSLSFDCNSLADKGRQCHAVTNALWWAHVRMPSTQWYMYSFPKILFLSGLVAQRVTRGLYAMSGHQIYQINQSGPIQQVTTFQNVY